MIRGIFYIFVAYLCFTLWHAKDSTCANLGNVRYLGVEMKGEAK